jgi:hypothetical protein
MRDNIVEEYVEMKSHVKSERHFIVARVKEHCFFCAYFPFTTCYWILHRPPWGSNPGLTDRLIVGRNVTLTLETTASNSSSIVAYVFVDAGGVYRAVA